MSRLSEALRIFRKDLVLLWPLAAAFAVLVAVLAMQDASLPSGDALYPELLEIPFVAACFYLTARVVRAEGLASACPYWVTRPISRGGLAAGKALALAVLLNLPLLAAQCWSLAANGGSPLEHPGLLLSRQVFFTARVVLPAAALAAVTTSWVAFAAGALAYLAIGQWAWVEWAPGYGWSRASEVAALTACAALLALGVQYARRRTRFAQRVLINAAWLICLWQIMSWRTGFEVQTWFTATAPAGVAHLAFAPSVGVSPAGVDPEHAGPRNGPEVGIALPIAVSGVAAEQGVRIDGIRTQIAAPGRTWDSGWHLAPDRVVASAAEPGAPARFLTSDGSYWLSFDVPAEFYRAAGETAADLRIALALTILADPTSTELELGGGHVAMGVGACWTHLADGFLEATCSSADWGAARTRVRVQSQSTGQGVTGDLVPAWAGLKLSGPGALNFGPWATGAGLTLWNDRVSGRVPAPPFPIDIILDTQRPASFAERTIEARGVRLAAFAVPGGH